MSAMMYNLFCKISENLLLFLCFLGHIKEGAGVGGKAIPFKLRNMTTRKTFSYKKFFQTKAKCGALTHILT